MPSRLCLLLPVILVTLIGCGPRADDPPVVAHPTPRPETGTQFNPATAGTIRGQVTWHGESPTLAPMTAAIPDGLGGYRWDAMTEPFAPEIDGKTHGLTHAVVSLKGINPETGRAWDLPPVQVVMNGYRILVNQFPNTNSRVGFVRQGDEVEMVSTDSAHHMLRARGAANVTLPFPDSNKPLRRRFDTPGLVELTSGAGYYWAAADLVVSDHPYLTVTDHEGRFTLPQVPPGKYELVCWVRNWTVVRKDRDPETGLVSRHYYAPPVEKRTTVTVTTSQTVEQDFVMTGSDFSNNHK